MAKCPKCGGEISEKAIFCESCGTKIEEKAVKNCPKCGSSNLPNSVFCSVCGQSFLSKKRSPFLTTASVMAFSASCFCFLTGMVGLFVYSNYSGSDYTHYAEYLILGIFGMTSFALGLSAGILGLLRRAIVLVIVSMCIIIVTAVLTFVYGTHGTLSFVILGVPILVFGVLSIIFTVISVKEFEKVGSRNCVSCGRSIDWMVTICPYCSHDYRERKKRMPSRMTTSKPVVAGVLMLFGGMLSITIFTYYFIQIIRHVWGEYPIFDFFFMLMYIAFILMGIFAIIGGAFSIIRKHYGWAKAGSIFTFIGWGFVFGIPALVLLVLAEDEFE